LALDLVGFFRFTSVPRISIIISFIVWIIWARLALAKLGCHFNLFYFVKKDFRLHPSREFIFQKKPSTLYLLYGYRNPKTHFCLYPSEGCERKSFWLSLCRKILAGQPDGAAAFAPALPKSH